MIERRDYYEILGIPRDADQKAVKDAFRRLALRYHPDRNKEAGAEETFKQIAEAYAVLSDPHKRAEYDVRGHAGVADFSPEDLFGGIDFGDIFGGLGFDFGGASFFDRFFGRRRGEPLRGANIEVDIAVPLAKIASGGQETITIARPASCPACGGSGAKAGTQPRKCAECGGTGNLVKTEERGGVHVQQIRTCPTCGGRGEIIDAPCPDCHGRGEIRREESLTVTIPVGVEDGTALRIPDHGMPSPRSGGTPGDLYVRVYAAPDSRFERRGADLWRLQTIEVADAVLGATIDVPTLEGAVTVTVPPGSQPDAILRLGGKGLPEFGGGRHGDLYLRLRVHVPEHLSAEMRSLYERLRALGTEAAGGEEPERKPFGRAGN